MTLRRQKHANLVGPAGLVSIDDSEALKYAQKAANGYPDKSAYLELDGRGEHGDHLLTEGQIRAFYRYYRSVMGFDRSA
jgi:anthranilate 1,2-dioxygenase large subunit